MVAGAVVLTIVSLAEVDRPCGAEYYPVNRGAARCLDSLDGMSFGFGLYSDFERDSGMVEPGLERRVGEYDFSRRALGSY